MLLTQNCLYQRDQNCLKNIIQKTGLASYSQQASDQIMPASHLPLLASLRVMSLVTGQLQEWQQMAQEEPECLPKPLWVNSDKMETITLVFVPEM